MPATQTGCLLYDSGKPDLVTRLVFTPVGLLFIWLVFPAVARKEIVAAGICGFMGLLFLFVMWFFQTRLYYDASARHLTFRDANTFWRSRHLSLVGAEAIYVKDGGTLTGRFSTICIRFHEGRDRWILRVPQGDPAHVAVTISDAIGLPIVQI
jgi:hypothetical protein